MAIRFSRRDLIAAGSLCVAAGGGALLARREPGSGPVPADGAGGGFGPPSDYQKVWSDEFRTLSLRTGGPSFDGLMAGRGTWASPGQWYSGDRRGGLGYGMDYFIDPEWRPLGPDRPGMRSLLVTPEGLRLRAEPPDPELARLLPPKVNGHAPWASVQIMSFHAVRITPPFYFEAVARMPVDDGRPFPAIWLCTNSRRPWPNDHGQEYEIDVHEGFGDDDRLHSTLHWHPRLNDNDYAKQTIVDRKAPADLTRQFNRWGCHVTAREVIIGFNGVEITRAPHPPGAVWNQPFGILLDVSAGTPWDNVPPSGGPKDMIVRSVSLYAPDRTRLVLNRPGGRS